MVPPVRLLALAAAVLGAGAVKYPYMAKDFEATYLGPLRDGGTAVHYGECAVDGGKVVLVLPAGAISGRMVDLHWGRDFERGNPAISNAADVTVVPEIKIDNLLVGGGARRFQIERVDFLLRRPMREVAPDRFHTIVTSTPEVTCTP